MVVSAAFPGMTVPLPVVQESHSPTDDDIVMADETVSDEDEEEEEIDDDEDGLQSGSGSVEKNGALTVVS